MSTQPTTTETAQDEGGQDPRQRETHDRGPGYVAGNLTRDPELRFTPAGTAVCSMRVADTPRVQNAQTGEWKDGPTVFRDVQCWARLAEHCTEALHKGDRIVAAGRIKSRSWLADDGSRQERVFLEARDLGPSMIFRPATVGPLPPRDVSQ